MLRLYRRHATTCPQTSEKYRRCSCAICAEGSLAGEYIRKSLDLTSWEAATKLIRRWETAGEIGGGDLEVPTIREAVEKYLADCEARNLRAESLRKARHALVTRFQAYCTHLSYQRLKEIDVDAARGFLHDLARDYEPNSVVKRFEVLRAFGRFCVRSGWLAVNPTEGVKNPKFEVVV